MFSTENCNGLVWDCDGKFIDQSWEELKQKALETHEDPGNIAADFHKLVRYGYTCAEQLGVNYRRQQFTKLSAEAIEPEDIKLLANILVNILLGPWKGSIEGSWFVYLLRKGSGLAEFDAHRAAMVLNELYTINDYAAESLMQILRSFKPTNKETQPLIEDINETGILRQELQ